MIASDDSHHFIALCKEQEKTHSFHESQKNLCTPVNENIVSEIIYSSPRLSCLWVKNCSHSIAFLLKWIGLMMMIMIRWWWIGRNIRIGMSESFDFLIQRIHVICSHKIILIDNNNVQVWIFVSGMWNGKK